VNWVVVWLLSPSIRVSKYSQAEMVSQNCAFERAAPEGGPTYAVVQTCTPRKREILMATLNALLVAIWLTLVTLAAAEAEPPERWTCAKWLDGREQRQSTTMETWVQGYVTSSNEWALALGWTVTPLQGPQVLPLLDQSCKSTPNARLADVVFDMIRSTFWPKNRRAIKRD
jgi:hypothetical protein